MKKTTQQKRMELLLKDVMTIGKKLAEEQKTKELVR